jgi:hypothetical protein
MWVAALKSKVTLLLTIVALLGLWVVAPLTALIFYTWPTSSLVLLFLFLDDGLTSIDCIS